MGGYVSTSANGGGGAGGRIAAYYSNTVGDTFYGGTFDSNGGAAGAMAESGASGTVYLKHTGMNFTKLIVDNKAGLAMDTELDATGQKIDLYNGNTGISSSFFVNRVRITSSCTTYNLHWINYPLSAMFDQSYKYSYQSIGGYTQSHVYTGNCHSGHIVLSLSKTILINKVRIFPVFGTNFKVF